MPGASAGKTGAHLPPSEKLFLARVVLGICERASTITDNFSGWLLAGFGGAVTLIVSNEDSISKRLPSERIDWVLLLFAASSAAGMLAKRKAISVARDVGVIGAVKEVFDDHDREEDRLQVDLPTPPLHLLRGLMLDAAPRPLRRIVERRVDASGTDILDSARKCARGTYWQFALTSLQVTLFAVAVVIVVWPRD